MYNTDFKSKTQDFYKQNLNQVNHKVTLTKSDNKITSYTSRQFPINVLS